MSGNSFWERVVENENFLDEYGPKSSNMPAHTGQERKKQKMRKAAKKNKPKNRGSKK